MLKISACVIVKNEEKNLPRWLRCAQALADELVVVDTGSTDGTVGFAEAAGARVYSFPWRDDFSAAKNFALRKATGSWVVFLDADEYFSDEDVPKVRAQIRRLDKDRRVGGLVCPLINIDLDAEGRFMDEGLQLRVFRRHPDLRFSGRIHEMLKARAGSWRMELVREVRIWHTGYSSSVRRAKAERNLAFLFAERERRGAEPADAVYLADCFYGLQRYEEAIPWAREALASDVILVGRERRPYIVLVGSLFALERPLEEIREAAAAALEKYPDLSDVKVTEGLAAWRAKDYALAEASFRAVLGMAAEEESRVRAVACAHLAEIARWRGRGVEAAEYAVEAVRRDRFYQPGLEALCRLLRPLPAPDVVQTLNALYDASAHAAFLARVLARNGLGAACLYYDRKAGGRVLSQMERLVFAGRFDAAADAVARGMAHPYALGALAARRMERAEALLPLFLPASFSLERGALSERLSRMERAFPWELAADA